jgi:fructokinase
MSDGAPLLGAIEAGGTKFVCAIGRAPCEVLEETRIATTHPAATLGAMVEFFRAAQARHGRVAAFGVASFGPVELERAASAYGRILPTPKPRWQGADLLQPLRTAFAVPMALDTDVNAAALAECAHGAGRDCRSLAYVTVGTGIGAGLVLNGVPVHGLMHPEIGHITVRRDPRDLAFKGTCPFHGDCLEGLACGPAIEARWGRSLDVLEPRHEAIGIIGNYLGQLAATLAYVAAIERVVYGGGVMGAPGLLAATRSAARGVLNGYLPRERYQQGIDQYIVAPGLGARSGLTGAFLLAEQAAQRTA